MPPAKQQPCAQSRTRPPQGGRPPPPTNVRTVRLPGREVNMQRARLWQDLDTNSALFDVTLQAADRAVPCNRCGTQTALVS
jgi:hypothetical protein